MSPVGIYLLMLLIVVFVLFGVPAFYTAWKKTHSHTQPHR